MTKEQTATYRAAFNEARESFEKASSRLRAVECEVVQLKEEILYLRRTITALAPLCSEDPRVDKLGITEICTQAMETIFYTAKTGEVVEWLEVYGYDTSSQKNLEASVHAVLTRLAKAGKIEKLDTEDGVRWRGPNYDKDLDPPF